VNTTKIKRMEFIAGLKVALPVILGFVPVGIAYAVMAGQAGMNVRQTILMSVFVFAGASQMMAAGMLGAGANPAAIVLTTFILNLRHVIMSACVFNRMKPAGLKARLLASFGITDESFAMFTTAEAGHESIWYFFGMLTVTYSSWIAGSAVGALVTGILPEIINDGLGIALYAMFIALLIPNIKQNLKLALTVGLTALINLFARLVIPASWALIVATLVGAAAGVWLTDDNPTISTAEAMRTESQEVTCAESHKETREEKEGKR
jgi:4-azaleucine resistance transporter AzlC